MFDRTADRTRNEFEALAVKHLDGLYAAALRLTKNQRDAEDLVQDTYLRAFRFFDRFERGTNIKAWLFKILTNTFINRYRRSVKERSLVDGPEQHFIDRLLSDDVLEALDAVPIDFRMAVILADLQDFSYREIADILDVPVGTVMSRLFRGRRLLQKSLAGYAVEAGVLPPGPTGERIDLEEYRRKRNSGA